MLVVSCPSHPPNPLDWTVEAGFKPARCLFADSPIRHPLPHLLVIHPRRLVRRIQGECAVKALKGLFKSAEVIQDNACVGVGTCVLGIHFHERLKKGQSLFVLLMLKPQRGKAIERFYKARVNLQSALVVFHRLIDLFGLLRCFGNQKVKRARQRRIRLQE